LLDGEFPYDVLGILIVEDSTSCNVPYIERITQDGRDNVAARAVAVSARFNRALLVVSQAESDDKDEDHDPSEDQLPDAVDAADRSVSSRGLLDVSQWIESVLSLNTEDRLNLMNDAFEFLRHATPLAGPVQEALG
jgi:hypothetical protein